MPDTNSEIEMQREDKMLLFIAFTIVVGSILNDLLWQNVWIEFLISDPQSSDGAHIALHSGQADYVDYSYKSRTRINGYTSKVNLQ